MRIWESCGRMVWRSLGAITRRGLVPRASSVRPSPTDPTVRSRTAMPQTTHMGARSLRCSGNGPLETRPEIGDRLLVIRQHSRFDQECHTRVRIDAAQGLGGKSAGLNHLLIDAHP